MINILTITQEDFEGLSKPVYFKNTIFASFNTSLGKNHDKLYLENKYDSKTTDEYVFWTKKNKT